MAVELGPSAVLVVSDDVVLGGLIARNLRLRGMRAEHAALPQALHAGWQPGVGRLGLLVVTIEAPERVPVAQVEHVLRQPWALGVPCVLAAERASKLAQQVGERFACPPVQPYDIGAIVAAARALLARSVPA